MSRTQKKCLIASGATHLVLLVVLIVTPAFLIKEEPPVDQTVMTLVNTEVASAAAAAPVVPPTPAPQPPIKQPDPPKPEERKPTKPKPERTKPEPKPEPTPVPEVKRDPPKKPDPKPEQPKPKPPKAEPVEIDTTVFKESPNDTKRRVDEQLRSDELDAIFDSAKTGISASDSNLKSTARISQGAYTDNYGSHVKNVYMRNWSPPTDLSTKNSVVEVEVVIKRNGSVKSARITRKSGNSRLDANITDLIKKRVTNMGRAFPERSKDSERTYTIEFNLNLKFSA